MLPAGGGGWGVGWAGGGVAAQEGLEGLVFRALGCLVPCVFWGLLAAGLEKRGLGCSYIEDLLCLNSYGHASHQSCEPSGKISISCQQCKNHPLAGALDEVRAHASCGLAASNRA